MTYRPNDKAISFDLDSLLADTRQRQWMVPKIRAKEGLTWDDYSMACEKDEPIMANIYLLRTFREGGFKILINTGRSECAKAKTVAWLFRYGIPFDDLRMRPMGYHVRNGVLKREAIEAFEAEHHTRVVLHVDDWDEVVPDLDQLGIPTVIIPGKFLADEKSTNTTEKG